MFNDQSPYENISHNTKISESPERKNQLVARIGHTIVSKTDPRTCEIKLLEAPFEKKDAAGLLDKESAIEFVLRTKTPEEVAHFFGVTSETEKSFMSWYSSRFDPSEANEGKIKETVSAEDAAGAADETAEDHSEKTPVE